MRRGDAIAAGVVLSRKCRTPGPGQAPALRCTFGCGSAALRYAALRYAALRYAATPLRRSWGRDTGLGKRDLRFRAGAGLGSVTKGSLRGGGPSAG